MYYAKMQWKRIFFGGNGVKYFDRIYMIYRIRELRVVEY